MCDPKQKNPKRILTDEQKKARNEAVQRWRERNPEKYRAINNKNAKRYYQIPENKVKKNAYQRRRLKKMKEDADKYRQLQAKLKEFEAKKNEILVV
tara:strand:+ start:3525 stop:3812 length:288 start_codon:yes stop_codon:yes gene_type:complete